MSETSGCASQHYALFTDLYQLTMLQAYHAEGMIQPAAFELFFRRMPAHRNYVLAAGLDDVLRYLEALRFTDQDLHWIAQSGQFSDVFIDDKVIWPGRKQVFRTLRESSMERDVIARHDQVCAGSPLLQHVMHQGERLPAGYVNLDQARRYASSQLKALPKRFQALDAVDAESAYPVNVSSQVHADTEALRADLQSRLS